MVEQWIEWPTPEGRSTQPARLRFERSTCLSVEYLSMVVESSTSEELSTCLGLGQEGNKA